MRTKPTGDTTAHPSEWPKVGILTTASGDGDVEPLERSFTAAGNRGGTAALEDTLVVSYKLNIRSPYDPATVPKGAENLRSPHTCTRLVELYSCLPKLSSNQVAFGM